MRRAVDEDESGDEAAPLLPKQTALRQIRAVMRSADQAFAPFSCPATAGCCQLAKTGKEPHLWPAEWALLDARLQRDALPRPLRHDGGCPLLDATGRRCTVYEDRPLGCRTFFCEKIRGPARQPVEAMDALSRKLRDLSEAMGDEIGPRPLRELLSEGN